MNEIVVTRAPRGREFDKIELSMGLLFVNVENGLCIVCENPETKSCIALNMDDGKLDLNAHSCPPSSRYHVFGKGVEGFLLMSKWVSEGRKLEDLQSDCKDEWIHVSNMKVGTVAEVMTRNFDDDDLVGKVVVRFDESTVQALDDPQCRWAKVDKITAPFSVWPLGPGDSITIKPKNP